MITFSKCLFKIPIPLEFVLSQLQGILLDTDTILEIHSVSPVSPLSPHQSNPTACVNIFEPRELVSI